MRHTQIEEHIAYFEAELYEVQHYPYQELVNIIQDVGFSCICCGKCCTAAFNGHIYLLSDDIKNARNTYPDLLVPAPGFELADRKGKMYASSYAIQMRPDGTCPFFQDGKCSDYQHRPFICKIYPYMLHREQDKEGKYDFRQISGLNQHGAYHTTISNQEAGEIADMIYSYEQAYLKHMIQFYQFMRNYFTEHTLRHSRQAYDKVMRTFYQGDEIDVSVFASESLISHHISLQSYHTYFNP